MQINLPATSSMPANALSLLTDSQDNQQAPIETGIEGPRRVGLTIAFVIFGVFGLWSTFAPIDSAAYAGGVVRVRSYNKIVQHLEGGIVQEIRVQNGDFVNEGDVLLVIDPTQALSQLESLRTQLLALSAIEARLRAEQQSQASVSYPAELLQAGAAGQNEIDTQNNIFATRKAALDGGTAVLEQRIGQLQSSLEGLRAQRDSKLTLAASFEDELNDFRPLLEEGFTDKQRLRELERNLAMQQGDAADLSATIASTEIRIGETRLEILQQQNEFQNTVANELAEIQVQLKDVRERVTALTDVVTRTEVRATATGVVTSLQVHTEGGVINPAAPIAEIVPQGDELVIEAMLAPTDIDRVAVGQEATVRLPAFNSKSVPTLFGSVLGVSADAVQNPDTGQSYYLARIQLTPESVADLKELVLVPGMPAEVLITTGSRTFLQYIMKPVTSSMVKSFRED
jgi:epimerase transport system membrane fusion protein